MLSCIDTRLLKTITDEQNDIFEKFDDFLSEYASLAEVAIFECAFMRGESIMVETFSDNE